MHKTLLVLGLLLISDLCWAQNSINNGEPQIQGPMRVFGNIYQWINGTEGKQVSETTGTTSLYVETTGSNNNDCRTVSRPCLTVQSAIDRIPRLIKHNVTVTIGSGNFAGFSLAGFIVPRGAVFTIQGTLGNPTLTGGSVSGTADSGDTTHCNHSTQAWTINELRGKLIKVGSEYRIVRENTANTTELVGPLSATCNGKAYELFEQKTVINSDSAVSGVRVNISGNTSTRESIVITDIKASGGTYGFYNRGGDGMTFQRLNSASASAVGIGQQSTSGEAYWYDNYSSGAGTYGIAMVEIGGQVRAHRNYVYGCTGSYYGFLVGGPGSCPTTNCNDFYSDGNTGTGIFFYGMKEIIGYRFFAKSNGGDGIWIAATYTVYIGGLTLESNTGDGLQYEVSYGQIYNATITGNGGYGIRMLNDSADNTLHQMSSGMLKLYGTSSISSNVAGGVIVNREGRIELQGTTGTLNGTYGLTVDRGASAEVNASTSVTGTTGDATVNGGVTTLTWATHFANNGDTAINTATCSKIERRD